MVLVPHRRLDRLHDRRREGLRQACDLSDARSPLRRLARLNAAAGHGGHVIVPPHFVYLVEAPNVAVEKRDELRLGIRLEFRGQPLPVVLKEQRNGVVPEPQLVSAKLIHPRALGIPQRPGAARAIQPTRFQGGLRLDVDGRFCRAETFICLGQKCKPFRVLNRLRSLLLPLGNVPVAVKMRRHEQLPPRLRQSEQPQGQQPLSHVSVCLERAQVLARLLWLECVLPHLEDPRGPPAA
eukprot:CAMPEP_0167797406 /NCGR_PEP_ID=MMETSP0111_2-20121227/15637_1 /TAXON_ID=91324 /ORGANISM="Lotharella globosa, Strain CCCM811" /LENGTH=237 /DNA_ID=CAMNT_0007691509 /DNA_START=94 /DNA_END=807 /DNA_ORIENTATION=+